ncbi:MAG: ATP-binding cassette subfamily F protein 3, partial [Alphaproteobacteria bacterium]
NDFEGAVILVSHDRRLLEATTDRFLLVANGRVTPFDGDLDDYRRFLLSGKNTPTAREKPTKTPKATQSAKTKKSKKKKKSNRAA